MFVLCIGGGICSLAFQLLKLSLFISHSGYTTAKREREREREVKTEQKQTVVFASSVEVDSHSVRSATTAASSSEFRAVNYCEYEKMSILIDWLYLLVRQ